MTERTLSNDALLGTTLDERFKVESLISRGGLSVLYRGTDKTNNETVCIRVLIDRKSEDDQSHARFKNAVKLVSEIEHPNIVPVVSSGKTRTDAPYLVLPFVEGRSVREKVETDGPLSIEDALPIIRDVAAALQCAHDNGIIHRNLKPSNILITTVDGKQRAVLTGFGIAKKSRSAEDKRIATSLIQTTKVVGSPLYMSPEQFINSTIDARSDVYSFGCVIHQMLSGKPPFDATNLVQLMGAHHHTYRPHFKAVSPELNVPEYVEDVLDAATFKLPDNRYSSVTELVHDLENHKCSINLRAAREREPHSEGSVAKQNSIMMTAYMSAAGILVLALVIFIISFNSMTQSQFQTGQEQNVVRAPEETLNPKLEELLQTGQYSQAMLLLENKLKADPDPVTQAVLHEKIAALGVLSDETPTAVKHYEEAIKLRQQAPQQGAEGLRHQHQIREDYAVMAVALIDSNADLAARILQEKVGPGVVNGLPAAYLVWRLSQHFEGANQDAKAAEIFRMFPKDQFPGNYEKRMDREDFEQYMISFVRGTPMPPPTPAPEP